jgi:hypothetical protein
MPDRQTVAAAAAAAGNPAPLLYLDACKKKGQAAA